MGENVNVRNILCRVCRSVGLVMLWATSACAAELSVERTSTGPRDQYTLAVRLSADSESIAGLQFDLDFDDARLEVTAEVGPAAQIATKILQTGVVGAGKRRILLIGFNRTELTSGIVAILHISVKPRPADQPATSADLPDPASTAVGIRLSAPAGTNADAGPVSITLHDPLPAVPGVRSSN